MFVVNLTAYTRNRGTGILLCFKGQADTDDFKWIGEEDRSDACKGARKKPTYRRLLCWRSNQDSSYLFVGKEFDCGIGKDAQEGCRVASEQTTDTILTIDVAHGSHDAEPGTSIFSELRVGSLEQDLDTIEGSNDCFGLRWRLA